MQISTPLLGRGRGRLRKLALPSLGEAVGGDASWLSPPWEGPGEVTQASPPLPWGGVGGGYLLNSFTNAFAGRGMLKNKSVTGGNTRVLNEFVKYCQSVDYKKQQEKQHNMMLINSVICVTLSCNLMQVARSLDADSGLI